MPRQKVYDVTWSMPLHRKDDSSWDQRIMEMEPDIENLTLNEYLEYEAVKERRLWDNVRSKSSPTRDTNHESGNLLNFSIFPATNEFSIICEQDVDLEKEEAQVEDDEDGDTYDIWDITV
ncbi:hypothetical protein Tco_0659263 [Tanacetum coccineum]